MWNAISLVQDLNSCRRVPFPTTITITPRASPYIKYLCADERKCVCFIDEVTTLFLTWRDLNTPLCIIDLQKIYSCKCLGVVFVLLLFYLFVIVVSFSFVVVVAIAVAFSSTIISSDSFGVFSFVVVVSGVGGVVRAYFFIFTIIVYIIHCPHAVLVFSELLSMSVPNISFTNWFASLDWQMSLIISLSK